MALLAGGLAAPAPASADPLLSSQVTAQGYVDGRCTSGPVRGERAWTKTVTPSTDGMLTATLAGGRGDWDLAVFDRRTGAVVAGSEQAGSAERASGPVAGGRKLIVQACPRPGAGGRPTAVASTVPLPPVAGRTSLVRVATPDRAAKDRLTASGLDLTEHAGPDFVDVVLHGAADSSRLDQLGLEHEVRIADLARHDLALRRADARFARRATASSLPSERTSYRRLFDYSAELKQLTDGYPRLVRHFTLAERTYEGRQVEGIEIGAGRRDGKPVFTMFGLHHAREWPSGEHTVEFAHDLLRGWRAKNPRARRLLKRGRLIIVPVVNPDGFNVSREFGELYGASTGRTEPEGLAGIAYILGFPGEYKRKNCRLITGTAAGLCAQPSLALVEGGVDPNRNYGAFWGGPGASEDPTAADHHGPGPFSEPETRNVQRLVSRTQTTVLITNHTFGNLILRPPGIAGFGKPPDERIYKRLAGSMADENGYVSQAGYQLYDTSGTTEDWSYSVTGGLGFTFEIGHNGFHPAFADMVAEYRGTSDAAGKGRGNRRAFYKAFNFAVQRRHHGLVRGKVPRGVRTVEFRKSFNTPTWAAYIAEDPEARFRDVLKTEVRVRRGRFASRVNPSTRPLVAGDPGSKRRGKPSAPITFGGGPDTTTPCADAESEDPGCFNDHAFVVPRSRRADNNSAEVRLEWGSLASDWDMQVFRDRDRDGSSLDEGEPVAVSQSGPGASEQATIPPDEMKPGRKFVVRVTNYAALEPYEGTVTFKPTPRGRPGKREHWTLVCRDAKERVRGRAKVFVDRGQLRRVDLRRRCR